MTLYQYNQLDEFEQIEYLWDKAVFLVHRTELPFNYAIYQIESFYIEVKYHIEKNILMGLRTFSSTGPLEPYLEQIKIRI